MYCWPPPDLIARLCHICNSVTLRRRRQRRSSFVKTRGHFCVISPPRLLDGRMLIQHVIVSKPNCPRAGLRVLRALLTRHDQRGNVQRSDRLSGIILASVCVTLEGQEILQSVGQGIFPLVFMLINLGHVILAQVVLLPKSAPAIKLSQELLQILQTTPQPLCLR